MRDLTLKLTYLSKRYHYTPYNKTTNSLQIAIITSPSPTNQIMVSLITTKQDKISTRTISVDGRNGLKRYNLTISLQY